MDVMYLPDLIYCAWFIFSFEKVFIHFPLLKRNTHHIDLQIWSIFQKNIDPKSIQMPYQPRQNSKGQWRSPQKNNICHHEKFRITTATEHSLCQNAVHRLKNNNKCDGVHKLTGNLSRFRCYIVKSDNGSASPSFPTMTVSVILTPMVIMLCKEIGMAITAIFL